MAKFYGNMKALSCFSSFCIQPRICYSLWSSEFENSSEVYLTNHHYLPHPYTKHFTFMFKEISLDWLGNNLKKGTRDHRPKSIAFIYSFFSEFLILYLNMLKASRTKRFRLSWIKNGMKLPPTNAAPRFVRFSFFGNLFIEIDCPLLS
jgi:hypothetical protein